MFAVLFAAFFSALVAVAVTIAIERLGGRLGGVLGTMPSTIVPAALGIYAQSGAPEHFGDAIGAAPVGMLLNVLFLYLWRVLPPLLPGSRLLVRLSLMTAASLGAWLVAATLAVYGLGQMRMLGLSALRAGEIAALLILVMGLWVARRPLPAPKGQAPVSRLTLVTRGLFAGISVGVAVWLARLGLPLVSGVAAVFPAIFLTAMASLWIAQAEAVPAGAVGPMMLGSASIGLFCLLAARTMPAWGATLGVIGAWLASVLFVTLPAARALSRSGPAGAS